MLKHSCNPQVSTNACRYEPTHDELYQAFQDAVGGAGEGEAEEQIDEDIAIEGGPQLARNDKCPVTGRAVRWVLGAWGGAREGSLFCATLVSWLRVIITKSWLSRQGAGPWGYEGCCCGRLSMLVDGGS